MAGVDPPCAAARCRFDQSASGAVGAQDCQAAITLAACDQGHDRKKITGSGAGWVRKLNQAATPKLPPPPPRQAQYRSACSVGLAVSTLPFAVTISTDSRASQVRPYARAVTPTPPPSVRPEMPTVGQEPPGTARPVSYTHLTLP